MPFPETTGELTTAGYKFDGESNCRACGARIEWWITPRNKKMPMDVDSDGNAEPHWASCHNANEFRNRQ